MINEDNKEYCLKKEKNLFYMNYLLCYGSAISIIDPKRITLFRA